MSNYQRLRAGFYKKNSDTKVGIGVNSEDYSRESFEELENKTEILKELDPITILYDGVTNNFSDINKEISQWESFNKDKHLSEGLDYNFMTMRSRIIMRITNFLTSANSFLMNAEIQLGRSFGKSSSEFIDWNNHRKLLHKESFAYRFSYRLRNYSQHYSLPVTSLSVKLGPVDVETEIKVLINRDILLDSGFDWAGLKADLIKYEDAFDLLPLLQQYMEIIDELLIEYVKACNDRLNSCIECIDVFMRQFNFPKGAVAVVFKGDGPIPEDYFRIPIERLHWILDKVRKALPTTE